MNAVRSALGAVERLWQILLESSRVAVSIHYRAPWEASPVLIEAGVCLTAACGTIGGSTLPAATSPHALPRALSRDCRMPLAEVIQSGFRKDEAGLT